MIIAIYDQISENLCDHLKIEVINLIKNSINYEKINDDHIYFCSREGCKEEIEFPEVPFLVLNSDRDSYIAFHYRCAFKKDSYLFIHLSQFINPCFL